jgi:hypothetical protein
LFSSLKIEDSPPLAAGSFNLRIPVPFPAEAVMLISLAELTEFHYFIPLLGMTV